MLPQLFSAELDNFMFCLLLPFMLGGWVGHDDQWVWQLVLLV